MEAAHAAPGPQEPIVDLVPVVRRVVAARVADHALREDIVQETLARVMASRSRIEHDSLVPYAVVTARNLIASTVKQAQSVRRVAHLLVEDDLEPRPDDGLLRREQAAMMETAMARLPAAERDVLLAHEVEGLDTATLAARRGSTPARSPRSSTARVPGCASSTSSPAAGWSRRPTAAVPSSSPCPWATGGASASSTRAVTSCRATSAPAWLRG